ncbi:MAG: insertion element protein [Neobacillus sp.]
MAKLKRLSTKDEDTVVIQMPLTSSEIEDRISHYNVLNPSKFSKRYNDLIYRPVVFNWNGNEHRIQFNFCGNPYCKWHGFPQERFVSVKSKPSRYRLSGRGNERNQTILCNNDPVGTISGMTWNCTTTPYSNWSIAEEIKRLTRIGTIKDVEPEYDFHKEDCIHVGTTPFEQPELFYKQGKSSTGTQRWQCKTCKKKTSLMPTRKQSTTYNQKRNEILPSFMMDVLNKTPVTRTCEKLGIGVSTYYHKLEWVYRRCLEFLERHETPAFAKMKFPVMWLNTDKMVYHLNNVRKKGQGGNEYDDVEESQFPTQIVVTSDVHSLYTFRADIAYDWDISLDEIKLDTVLLKEDHINEFCRKHGRFKDYSFCPQLPTENDTQTEWEYRKDMKKFERRDRYIDGLHTNSTYTTFAHLWLIKQMIKASEWRFVTDKDNALMTAYSRVFAKEIRLADAHQFICLTDKTKSLKQCNREYKEGRIDLLRWGSSMMHDTRSYWKLGYLYLCEVFQNKTFHEEVIINSYPYRKWAEDPVEHPIPTRDKGFYKVDCKTDLSSLEPEEIADSVLNVSDYSTNVFIQQIRRRLSFLERPLVTARGDGKSYIYANFNPKYAQYALTILRTYYNFCETSKGLDGEELTPAQRLGISHKKFDIKDILYLQ